MIESDCRWAASTASRLNSDEVVLIWRPGTHRPTHQQSHTHVHHTMHALAASGVGKILSRSVVVLNVCLAVVDSRFCSWCASDIEYLLVLLLSKMLSELMHCYHLLATYKYTWRAMGPILKHDVVHKVWSTWHIAMPPEEDRATGAK